MNKNDLAIPPNICKTLTKICLDCYEYKSVPFAPMGNCLTRLLDIIKEKYITILPQSELPSAPWLECVKIEDMFFVSSAVFSLPNGYPENELEVEFDFVYTGESELLKGFDPLREIYTEYLGQSEVYEFFEDDLTYQIPWTKFPGDIVSEIKPKLKVSIIQDVYVVINHALNPGRSYTSGRFDHTGFKDEDVLQEISKHKEEEEGNDKDEIKSSESD